MTTSQSEKSYPLHLVRSIIGIVEPAQATKRFPSNARWTLGSYAGIAVAIFLINVSWLAWAKARYATINVEGRSGLGYGEVFSGDCSQANTIDTWLHFLINALSTLLLAGSNAFLTAFNAPSRTEVDEAHSRQQWLHIGVTSFRNFRFIAKRKTAVCLLLIVTSLPFNLIYNSLIFTSTSANEYHWAVALPEFHNTSTWAHSPPAKLWYPRVKRGLPDYTRLDPITCQAIYRQTLISGRRDVLFVTKAKHIVYSGPHPFMYWGHFRLSAEELSAQIPDTVPDNDNPVTVWGQVLSHCMSEIVEPHCSVQFSWNIMVAVLICNALKVGIMLLIILNLNSEKLLITVGDGISSFLTAEDPTTKNIGLVSLGSHKPFSTSAAHLAKSYRSVASRNLSSRWLKGIRGGLWVFYVSLWITVIMIAIAFYVLYGGESKGLFKSFGLGRVNPLAFAFSPKRLSSVTEAALLANLPQLFLSIVYFIYQNIIISMFIANDYNNFALKDQALMVTFPVAGQRSHWFFGVPFKAGVVLQGFQFLLHWLVSQSLFPVGIVLLNKHGHPISRGSRVVNCGYSPLAVLLALIAAAILLLSAWAIGLVKLKGRGPPVASTSSVALSAACHVPSHLQTDDMVYGKLRWGAVDDGSTDLGHCSFAPASAWHAGKMHEPVPGRCYL